MARSQNDGMTTTHDRFARSDSGRTSAARARSRLSQRVRVRPAHENDLPAVREVIEAAYRRYALVMAEVLFEPYLADVLDVRARMAAGVQLGAVHGNA